MEGNKEELLTAEEFYRNKFRQETGTTEEFSLRSKVINLELAMRWAHEFKELHIASLTYNSKATPRHRR